MNSFELIAALALPDDALVDRRVPKTLLIENGAPTAADKPAHPRRESRRSGGWPH